MTRTEERWERNTEVCCRCCGQKLPDIRFGVRLTPLKARIFDAVQRSGEDGISMRELKTMIWGRDTTPRQALKSHVWQINELMGEAGYRIVRCGGGGSTEQSYRLYKSVKNDPIDIPDVVPLKSKTRHG